MPYPTPQPDSQNNPRYPRTPYAPFSPSVNTGRTTDRPTADLSRFTNIPMVITEKLDGSNIRLHDGRAYPRSPSSSGHPWMAMVRKHHAWKTAGNRSLHLYGEDIYAVHAIRYDPVPEDRTLYLFAALTKGTFEPWDQVEALAQLHHIPTAPVLHKGTFHTPAALRDLCLELAAQPSALGPQREGIVVRTAEGFPQDDFQHPVFKVVRADHVQPDQEHWSRRWQPCRILPPV